MNRILYQVERLKKISKDMKTFMERIASDEEFELYLKSSKKLSNEQ